MTTLYAKDSKGKLRLWGIVKAITGFYMRSGLVDGKQIEKYVPVVPKANRSLEEQMDLEIASRVKRKIDAGFVHNKDEAETQDRTNGLGFMLPMLAKPKVQVYDKQNSFVQIKYNGLRCLITKINGIKYAYSKSGILYPAIKHILDSVNIPEGMTIDGELYCHGIPLQTINSWVKKAQPETARLVYHCYDTILPNDFGDRLNQLYKIPLGDSAIIVPTWSIQEINIVEKMAEVRAEGYEGLIIRQPGFGYQSGKRNTAMLKVKQFLDDEFKVWSITKTKDGFARLHLTSSTGKPFAVLAPGNHSFKRYILNNQHEFIHKNVEIEFAEFSKDGIPQQPVAKHFRDFE